MISFTLTAKEAATLIALCDQEADGLEEDPPMSEKLARQRARYLRALARKVEKAGE